MEWFEYKGYDTECDWSPDLEKHKFVNLSPDSIAARPPAAAPDDDLDDEFIPF
jgi:hypothetical protein